jgi:formiminotetrahydrofolate cyclodeaminase
MYRDESLKKFLTDLGARLPAPGGGSAAALVAATGVALLEMVANFTTGKEKFKGIQQEIELALKHLSKTKARLLELVDEDVKAYEKFSQIPKSDEKSRQVALKEAAAVPLEICQKISSVLESAKFLEEKANQNLVSDVACAAYFLESAFASALINIEINLKYIADETFVIKTREAIGPLEKQLRAFIKLLKDNAERKVKTK